MKITNLWLLVSTLLALGSATPASSQAVKEPATKFSGFICEIDLSVLPVDFPLPDGTSVFTFKSRRECAGSASRRNVKLECEDVIPGWNLGNVSATNFICTINGDTCNLTPRPGDPNAPFLTATQQQLTVSAAGKAKLTCFFKP
jgi:hypothetical protein